METFPLAHGSINGSAGCSCERVSVPLACGVYMGCFLRMHGTRAKIRGLGEHPSSENESSSSPIELKWRHFVVRCNGLGHHAASADMQREYRTGRSRSFLPGNVALTTEASVKWIVFVFPRHLPSRGTRGCTPKLAACERESRGKHERTEIL